MDNLFEKLGLSTSNGLYITKRKTWYGLLSKRIEEFFESKYTPDAFFCIDKKPFILFYDISSHKKGDSFLEREKIFKAVWNFNDSPIVFIINDDSIEIYNGFKYLKDKLELDKIKTIKYNNEDLKNSGFTYNDIIDGKVWKKYESKFNYKNRVDYHLLDNIKYCRERIIREGLERSLANRLLGKVIFIRYLIDRNVRINFEGHKRFENNDFAEILKDGETTQKFFDYIQEKFNGNLFNISRKEYNFDPKIFLILRELILGSTIGPIYIEPTLFDIYDFSIIPVEFISNVYELFIGQENQANSGAYYTPVFLVDYILKETIEKYFMKNPDKYNCKILDPACGSGVFLVEAYRKIVKQHEKLHPNCKQNKKEYKNILKQLALDNIFGIDEDKDAVSVATFSIYLTMLHYQEPADIEDFKFPPLNESNFFVADFFDSELDNIDKLKGFNFIIGNPPWKRGNSNSASCTEYIEGRRKKEENKGLKIGNKEIAQAFLLRTSDFSSENTKCALIITSKIFYNLQSQKFREYFLENFFIDKIFEMSAVRREIFNRSNDKSIAPPAILFYRHSHGRSTDKNIIEHIALKPNRFFSSFKIFTINRNDHKRVAQKRLKDYDYLWKILVYGSYLDFNFIKRLKENYKTIGDIILKNKHFLVKQGIKRKDGERSIDVEELINLNFLKTRGIDQYWCSPKLEKWKDKYVGYIYRIKGNICREMFKAPILLINGGINKYFNHKSAISYDDVVYLSSLTGVKTNIENINILKQLNAYFNSTLFSYSMLMTGVSAGIEREESEDFEKWQVSYVENQNLPILVTEIERLKKEKYSKEKAELLDGQLIEKLKREINQKVEEVNRTILKGFNLSKEEYALVDYAVNITIPLIMRHKNYEKRVLGPISNNSKEIKKYIKVFQDRFNPTLKKLGLQFNTEVWHSKDFIGLFFKEASLSDPSENNFTIKMTSDFLHKIASLGVNKITERLLVQKDIRGFEKNGFYIIKPNEKRLWHEAIAYLDMYEFADAILSAGMKTDMVKV